MAHVFITGSTDGLGFMAAEVLASEGHDVVLHARNAGRAEDARRRLPGAEGIVTGDLSSIEQTRRLADQVNECGPFDAVIHNAGVYGRERVETGDGLPGIFAVNVLAPYLLTALIQRPQRLVYLSSGMHRGANADLSDPLWKQRKWDSTAAYSESKLHDLLLTFAVARYWPATYANAVNPGWVPTKMGGASAPDDLDAGCRTQAWLAVSSDDAAHVTGKYFHHMRSQAADPFANDPDRQDRLIELCGTLTGIELNKQG
jgi:NAD(P)-dependent dehydrogenase (short-subunit alcohol dehydrogenase family)